MHIVIMLAELKQLPAQTKHRAFILQGNVQSCLHNNTIVGCTIGFRVLQGPSPTSLRRGRWIVDSFAYTFDLEHSKLFYWKTVVNYETDCVYDILS